jgi:hypothetical protein
MLIPTGESQEVTLATTPNIVKFLVQLDSIESQIVGQDLLFVTHIELLVSCTGGSRIGVWCWCGWI